MKGWIGISVLVLVSSCVSLHTPSSHFVPSISDKNQFEGDVSVGYASAGVNAAYSPIKHLNLLTNVQVSPFKVTSQSYQRNCELALGFYNAGKKVIYGLNAGYGMGKFDWKYTQFNDSTSYSLYTKGDFQKLMAQAYFSFTNNASDPKWQAGISVKQSFFWDRYVSLRYTHQNSEITGLSKTCRLNLVYFTGTF